jgi:hypothetical protein
MASLRDIEADFPLLVGTNYSEESAATDVYNCIAFAVGDFDNWWWPRRGYGMYWPPGFPLSDSVDVLIRIFEVHGYSQCADADPEPGYEKIAIYTRERRFKHAARQVKSGRWASKLGEEQDIEHERVEHVRNASYGVVEDFLRRKREDWLLSEQEVGAK